MVCKMVPGDYTPAKCYVNTSAMVFASNRSGSDDGQEVRMALIVVRDMTSATLQVGHTTLSLASTVRVNSLLEHVASLANYQNGTFELVLQQHRDSNTIILNDRLNETLESAGFVCDNGQTRNSLIIADMGKGPPVQNEPRGNKMIIEDGGDDEKDKKAILDDETKINEPLFLTGSREYSDCNISDSTSSSKQGIGFVGLVNQAMTCYLNSLIQTLYMTPEFRNALYRWRFEGTAEEQEKSIPFQLQSLFIQLQTTEKASIGTTNLTRSFGWDSSEAWQQHDIQELCRVMFDALEHNFKRTEQADLISRLYEGKMVDYVRCLDCRTEKSREDTFLDIPLPVRPFGSQNAYASVEEALKAFVAPETLDGNNQYWCEKCNKKCDAHKGLKFSRFPYLLTLHLKRFDFDYNTLHRIKLNDKVTFPEILNLESFIEDESTKESHDTAIDDSMSEVSESSRANSSNDPESQDDDEGIDVRTDGCTGSTSSTCDSSESRAKGSRENRRNRSSPACSYELFSIMIHSGSASGGHYYAYIKDFISQQWFCFNDQSVSRITYDDIRRTYGGGPSRSAGYFTSAYTSSTNAYMLMYREIDKARNANFISPAEFPEHLKRLLERMNKEEEALRQVEENERNTRRIQLYCHHPRRGRIDIPLKVHKDVTLRQATSLAYEKIGDLQDLGIPLERCRLVKYNEFYDSIECSWDDRSEDSVSEILGGIRFSYKFDLLLEIIGEGQQFIVYNYTPDSVSIKIVYVDVDSKEWRTPVSIRLSNSSSVLDLKEAIKSSLNIAEGVDQLYLCRIHHSALRSLNQDDRTLRTERFQKSEKVYATVASADEDEFDLNCKSRFHELIDLYENITTIRVTLPRVDKDILERLGISNTQEYRMIPRTGSPMESFSPDVASDDSLSHLERERALSEGEDEEHDVREDFIEDAGACMAKEDAVHEDFSEGDDHVVEGFPDNRPCLPVSTSSASASEDSSLSLTDSDRTLLGDPRESEDPSSAQSGSQRRNAMAEAEPKEVKYYFKVVSNVEQCGETVSSIMVDKRMSLSQFKLELESLLNVPFDFLLVYKKATYPAPSLFDPTDREWVQPHETLETLGDDNQLLVRLGRVLRPGEIKGKIFQLSINDVNERSKFLFEWVLSTGVKVGSMKREILAEIQLRYGYEIPYNKCILRKKKWRTPSTVYGNEEETFDGELVYMLKNWEMYLQVLDADNAKEVADNYNGAETSVFLRRWRPSTFTLENFVDVPLVNLSRLDLGHKLIELSGIPMERIEVAKAPKTFPCEGSLLAIQDDILWVSLAAEDDSPIFKFPHNVPIRDGDVIYWRDTQEEVKKLTEQERKEILRRENGDEPTLVGPTYTAASTSPRKERPLRIYLDTPSVKEDISLD